MLGGVQCCTQSCSSYLKKGCLYTIKKTHTLCHKNPYSNFSIIFTLLALNNIQANLRNTAAFK